MFGRGVTGVIPALHYSPDLADQTTTTMNSLISMIPFIRGYTPVLLLFFIPLSLVAQLPGYVPVTGLEAWYSFSGNTTDDSGNGIVLTNFGCALTADRFGVANQAYDFSHATNSRFEGTLNAPLDTAFTFSAWIRRNSLLTGPGIHNKQWVFAHGTDVTNQSAFVGIRESSQELLIGNWDNTPPSGYDVDTTWAHVVIVATPSQRHLYVDCQLDTTLSIPYPAITSANFEIGSQIGALMESWDGQIDDVGIWSRALDSFEVVSLCMATSVLDAGTYSERQPVEKFHQDQIHHNAFRIFPNPATAKISITCEADHFSFPLTLNLLNSTGALVLHHALDQPDTDMSLQGIPSGMYVLIGTDQRGQRVVERVLVE